MSAHTLKYRMACLLYTSAAVETDLNALKDLLAQTANAEMTDAQIADIKAAQEKMMESAQKLFAKMYEQTQQAGGQEMCIRDRFYSHAFHCSGKLYVIGAKDIIEKILPVVDNFERGLAQAPEDDPFAEGMQKIYKQFTTTMEGMGVEPIEAVGKEFNPDFHNAVMHVEDESVGENIVVEELQKGYTLSLIHISTLKMTSFLL